MFDEFDSTLPGGGELGWLKFFLSPMHDGTFVRKGKVYHIGRAIFVFAGGLNPTYDVFDDNIRKKMNDGVDTVKGRDFISRLRGHLDIASLDSPKENAEQYNNNKPALKRDHDDALIRRAIVLRSILEKKPKRVIEAGSQIARVDTAVIQAFLDGPDLRHGVRSMEAIVEMATLYDDAFLVASLPPKDQLDMHVDSGKFLARVKNI